MLKLIMAVSDDGYLARGPVDDMRWTGETDKKVFRLLTQVGGVCGVGHNSWQQMPERLEGRRMVPLTSDGRPVRSKGSLDSPIHAVETSLTLEGFAYSFPEGWLLGGPTLAQEALEQGLVDEVYLSRCPIRLGSGLPDTISPWLMSRGEIQNAGTPWRRAQRIPLEGLTIDCWASYGKRPQPRNVPLELVERPQARASAR